MKRGLSTIAGYALASVALCGLVLAPSLAFADNAATASEKEETVHVYTYADGSVKSSEVDAKLSNPQGATELSDVSNLTEIEQSKKNSKSEKDKEDESASSYKISNDEVVWQANGKDVSYTGTTTADMPVKVHVTYRFNGSYITPRELVGKTGRVTIRYEYENTSYVLASIGGATERIYTPFFAITGMILDNDTFNNIQVENGRIMEDDGKTIVVGFAMPGLQESLGVDKDSVDVPSYFEVTADAKNFELKSTITMISPNLLDDIDLSSLDTSELSSAGSSLESAMSELIEGSGQLDKGLVQLADGSALMKSMAEKVPQGTNALAQGGAALQNGLGKAVEGVTELKEGAALVNESTQQLAGAIGVAKNSVDSSLIPGLTSTSKIIDKALAELQSAGDVKTALEKLVEAGQIAKQVKSDTDKAKADLSQGITALEGVSLASVAADAADAEASANKVASDLAVIDTALDNAKNALSSIDTEGMTDEQIAAINNAKTQLNGISTDQANSDAATAAAKAKSAHDGVAGAETSVNTAKTALETAKTQLDTDAATLSADADALAAIDPTKAPISDATKVATMQGYLQGAKDGVDTVKSGLSVLSKGGTLPDGSSTGGLQGALDALGSAKTPGTILFATNALYQGSLALADDGTGLPAAYLLATQIASGANELNESAPLLVEGLDALAEGSQSAAKGSNALTEGMKAFDAKGLSKLISALDNDIVKTVDRLDAIHNAGKAYANFSGITEGTSGSVKFVYETDAIKAE